MVVAAVQEVAQYRLVVGLVQCLADACVFRLMKEGSTVMTRVVHVDDIFVVGEERCDQFGRDLNQMVPVKNLADLRWYSGCVYERDWEKGVIFSSQQRFAEQWADEYEIEFGKSAPLSVGTRFAEFDENEAPGDWPFREMIGSLMWLSTQTRPDISNAARAVARYCAAPEFVNWRAARGNLGCTRFPSGMCLRE